MTDLNMIKGIGPKTEIALSKLGIHKIEDFLTYYPYRYERMERSNINMLKENDKIIIDGYVDSIPSLYRINRKMDKMSFRILAEEILMNVTIYNRGFLKNKLLPGSPVTVIGKYNPFKHSIIATDILLSMLPSIPKIEPFYHTTYGISNKNIRQYMNEVLKGKWDIIDYIPKPYFEQYHFMGKQESIYEVHIPSTIESLKNARLRLKYEEMFIFMARMNYLKQNQKNQLGLKREVLREEIDAFIKRLPFILTEDQLRSIDDIYKDLMSEKRMNRLLQGDVGSGKTIVAFIAMYMNHLSGYQSALMAPTEILATQHYENMLKLFPSNVGIGLLTGKMKAKEKRELLEKLKTGEIQMIVGTHALISENVEYQNLGLVITDEQHRFGVNQRSNLKNKGAMPDILYMSATPIPRTYALTLYGDMDISSIKTMPNGRKEVITYLKKETELKEVLSMMLEELKKGHQIYVIAPLIEESDKSDFENVEEMYGKMHKAFGKFFRLGMLHGKMANDEKEKVMDQFKQNEIQILISTTVIEVGVDVKNATMIVIFDSYRFGLSALHQLRGRVGRNEVQSYCILISNRETERLNILTKTNDGFLVSEEDFKLRGGGDLFGSKQSGDMVFQIADLKKDYSLLLKAKDDSLQFITSDEYKNDIEYQAFRELIESSCHLD